MTNEFWAGSGEEGGPIIGEVVHMVDLMPFLLNSELSSAPASSLPPESKEPIILNSRAASCRFADGFIGNLTHFTVGSSTSAGELAEVSDSGLGVSSEDTKQLSIKEVKKAKSGSRKLGAEKEFISATNSFVAALRGGREPEVAVLDRAKASLGCTLMIESKKAANPPEHSNFLACSRRARSN